MVGQSHTDATERSAWRFKNRKQEASVRLREHLHLHLHCAEKQHAPNRDPPQRCRKTRSPLPLSPEFGGMSVYGTLRLPSAGGPAILAGNGASCLEDHAGRTTPRWMYRLSSLTDLRDWGLLARTVSEGIVPPSAASLRAASR
jgi:hypothetical protein